MALTSIAGFDPNGGWLIVAPGEASQEIVLYEGVDTASSAVTSIYRALPATNPVGTSVAASSVGIPPECSIAIETTTSVGDIDTACVDALVAMVNDLVVSVCTGGITAGSASTSDVSHPCVDMAFAVVDTVLMTVCQSTDAATCAANLIDRIDTTLGNACYGSALPTGGSVTGLPPGVGTCVTKVIGTFELVMTTVCQSTNATTCVNNLIDKVDDTLGLACGAVPVAPGGTATGVPPGVAECVVTVLGTVNLVLTTACQSTTAQTCAANLLDKINDILVNACTGQINLLSSTFGDAVATCSNTVVSAVNTVMTTVCQSTVAGTCASNLLDKINDLLVNVCGAQISLLSSTESDALATCTNTVISVVNTVMLQVCQSTDAVTCANNLVTRVDAEVRNLCSGVSTEAAITGTTLQMFSLTTGVIDHPCLDEIDQLVDTLPPICTDDDGTCVIPEDNPCGTVMVCKLDFRQSSVDQPIPDFVLSFGKTCASKVVVVSLYLPPGVTSKGVTTSTLEDGLCTQEVSDFRVVGSPGAYEPYETTTDMESNELPIDLSDGSASSLSTSSTAADTQCPSAAANYVHTSHTIQDGVGIDVAWLRTTHRRLWGCDTGWWSERYPRVFAWSGSGPQHWTHQFPAFEAVDWYCHPPGKCSQAWATVHADYHTEFPTCDPTEEDGRISTITKTFPNGGRRMVTWKNFPCEGLHSATDVATSTSMSGPFADSDPEDLFRCAVADNYRNPEGRTCPKPY